MSERVAKRETCGVPIALSDQQAGRCGKPAVDFVDIEKPKGGTLRIYLCADHVYWRVVQ